MDVARLLAPAARCQLEADPLPGLQDVAMGQRRDVDEHVRGAAAGDEAEAAVGVEARHGPGDGAGRGTAVASTAAAVGTIAAVVGVGRPAGPLGADVAAAAALGAVLWAVAGIGARLQIDPAATGCRPRPQPLSSGW